MQKQNNIASTSNKKNVLAKRKIAGNLIFRNTLHICKI